MTRKPKPLFKYNPRLISELLGLYHDLFKIKHGICQMKLYDDSLIQKNIKGSMKEIANAINALVDDYKVFKYTSIAKTSVCITQLPMDFKECIKYLNHIIDYYFKIGKDDTPPNKFFRVMKHLSYAKMHIENARDFLELNHVNHQPLDTRP